MAYTANIIPAMTGYSSPSGVASASGEYTESFTAWKAFNHAADGYGWATGGTTGWVKYQFPTARVVTQYAVTSRNEAAPHVLAPKTWTLYASNDGSSWTALDTQTNIVDWASVANSRKVFTVANSAAYLYYSLDITASNDATNVGVGELEMMETVSCVLPVGTAWPTVLPVGTSSPTVLPVGTAWPTALPVGGAGAVTPEPAYGCSKPQTTSVLTNYVVPIGTHDVTYSRVRFEGYTGTDIGTWAVVLMQALGGQAPPYNITFDRCVFATPPNGVAANAFKALNYSAAGAMHGITFDHCWFEPCARMSIESLGVGGWFHTMTVNRCTFEACCGEVISVAQFLDGDWTLNDRSIRGVENLIITENEMQGTGATVGGVSYTWGQAIELADVYPYLGTGASLVARNRIGRTPNSWLNCSWSGTDGVTIEDNVFDNDYNPGDTAAAINGGCIFSGRVSTSTFRRNTWTYSDGNNLPYYDGTDTTGDGNTFEDEVYTKVAGSFGGGIFFPHTDSTYTDCHFHLNSANSVQFAADAVGTGCVFDVAPTGGMFT